jgi:hypothetical protein
MSGASVRLILLGPPQIEFAGATSALAFERRDGLTVFFALSW